MQGTSLRSKTQRSRLTFCACVLYIIENERRGEEEGIEGEKEREQLSTMTNDIIYLFMYRSMG